MNGALTSARILYSTDSTLYQLLYFQFNLTVCSRSASLILPHTSASCPLSQRPPASQSFIPILVQPFVPLFQFFLIPFPRLLFVLLESLSSSSRHAPTSPSLPHNRRFARRVCFWSYMVAESRHPEVSLSSPQTMLAEGLQRAGLQGL